MWSIILLILSLIAMVQMWRMIRYGFQLGTRVTIATEANQALLQTLVDALSPEAKERAIPFMEERRQKFLDTYEVKAKHNQLKGMIWMVVLVIIAILFALMVRGAHAEQQTRVYDARGNSVGTIVPQGQGSQRYYDSRGNSQGTSTTRNGTTTFYSTNGSVTGRTTTPQGGRR